LIVIGRVYQRLLVRPTTAPTLDPDGSATAV